MNSLARIGIPAIIAVIGALIVVDGFTEAIAAVAAGTAVHFVRRGINESRADERPVVRNSY